MSPLKQPFSPRRPVAAVRDGAGGEQPGRALLQRQDASKGGDAEPEPRVRRHRPREDPRAPGRALPAARRSTAGGAYSDEKVTNRDMTH